MWEPAHAWILRASAIMPEKAGAGVGRDGSKETTCRSGLKAEGSRGTGQRLLGKLGSGEGTALQASLRSVGTEQERGGVVGAGDGLLAAGCEVCSQAELPDLVNSRKPCLVN